MSTEPTEDRLGELLLRWDELRREGRNLPPEELCTDCPELAVELRRRIEVVQGMNSVLDVWSTQLLPTPEEGVSGGTTGLQTIPHLLSALAAYHPERHHARGGLGEVFSARQEELDRVVALKRIRPDKLHEATRRRFLREAAITARLQHPGIIPIYSLGHDDGGPFYTMPFIHGQTLEEAIEDFHTGDGLRLDAGRRSLKLRGLLQHLITTCNTVAYAHDQGVVHRDLKPSNIMLGPYGETLVMDWGLAKRFGDSEPAAETSEDAPSPSPTPDHLTATGAVLGTPRYMSPEQAKGEPSTPASDVFSLGVIMYAILTGKPAFDEAISRGADPLKAVREAAVMPPRKRDPSISHALEAVCLRALAARPFDRYSSARDLASDLEKWLAEEPVTAWSEPYPVRARRWMRRNRTMVTSTAAVVVLGLAGLAGVAIVLADKNHELGVRNQELDRQRITAVDQRNRAVNAEQAARNEEAKTRKSESEARAVLEFFAKKVVAAARPRGKSGGLGIDATIRAAVDAAEPAIKQSFAGQPTVEASIRDALGESYYYLGETSSAILQFERASMLYRQALGPDDQRTLGATDNLASAYSAAGRHNDALALKEETVRRSRAALGPNHPDTLISIGNLAAAYEVAGRYKDALALFEESLSAAKSEVGLDHPLTLLSMNNLANAYWSAGRMADAVSLQEKVLERQKALLGPDHPDTLLSMANLSVTYCDVGRHSDGIRLFRETLNRRQVTLGPDHPDTILSMRNLGVMYSAIGRISDAIPVLEEALKRRRAKLDLDPLETAQTMNDLARAYVSGKPAEAELLARESLAIREKKAPADFRTFETRALLGASLLGQKQYAAAEPPLLQGYLGMKAREPTLPAAYTRREVARAGAWITQLYDAWGKKEKAEEWRRKLSEQMLDRNFPADPFAP